MHKWFEDVTWVGPEGPLKLMYTGMKRSVYGASLEQHRPNRSVKAEIVSGVVSGFLNLEPAHTLA